MSESTNRVRVPDLRLMKERGQKIVVLTAYDATFAGLFDRAGVDVLLVGDSLGNVVMGLENTLGVTLDAMIHHTAAVSRGTKRALVVADMPFLTFQLGVHEAVRNAGRLLSEGNAAAVKLEGGRAVVDAVARMSDVGIPVMGHLGLLPQSVHKLGGFGQQAKDEHEADRLVADAKALEAAGAFSIVLESIPAALAARVTSEIGIPTIGIGAGPHCDGQVLVSYDVLGLYEQVPSFVKQYAGLAETIVEAAGTYARDVREGRFPAGRREGGPREKEQAG